MTADGERGSVEAGDVLWRRIVRAQRRSKRHGGAGAEVSVCATRQHFSGTHTWGCCCRCRCAHRLGRWLWSLVHGIWGAVDVDMRAGPCLCSCSPLLRVRRGLGWGVSRGVQGVWGVNLGEVGAALRARGRAECAEGEAALAGGRRAAAWRGALVFSGRGGTRSPG